jgi:hypothetical protein
MHRLAFLILALAAGPAIAQEPPSVESVAAAYFGTQTYCDSGKQGWRDEPTHPFAQEFTFVRCAQRDGRFKQVETDARFGLVAKWSDGRQYYRYLEKGLRYQELPLDDPYTFGLYRDRGQIYPVFVFEPFSADPRRLVTAAERASYFKSYTINASLSSPQHTVFEQMDAKGSHGERLWVLNSDRSIFRHERLKNGGVVRYVDITSREVNRSLTDADLWYGAPFYARFSMSNNPAAFIAGLFVAVILLAALVWAWLFSRAASLDDVLRKRRKLWRVQMWAFIVTASGLAVLAVITAPGGGHPPAIVFVFVLAGFAAIAFGLAACFTLVSYPVQLLFKGRSTAPD